MKIARSTAIAAFIFAATTAVSQAQVLTRNHVDWIRNSTWGGCFQVHFAESGWILDVDPMNFWGVGVFQQQGSLAQPTMLAGIAAYRAALGDLMTARDMGYPVDVWNFNNNNAGNLNSPCGGQPYGAIGDFTVYKGS